MHTLGDLLSQVRTLDAAVQTTDGSSLLRPSKKIIIPGAVGWKLPADSADAAPVLASTSSPTSLQGVDALRARSLLLNEPSFVVELIPPDVSARAALAPGIAERKHHIYRSFLFAVAVSGPVAMEFGRARLDVLDGEPRPGRSTILRYGERWFADREDLAVDLGRQLRDLPPNMILGPEPGTVPWIDAVALLGGGVNIDRASPQDWQRSFETTAALYAVHLDIRPDPDSARQKTVGDLRSNPPHGLLVWQGWVKSPDVYLAAFRKAARPGAYADCLGSAYPRSKFADDTVELHVHLAAMSPITGPVTDATVDNWNDAAAKIKTLEGPHFKLSGKVRDKLHECPYPDPQRMLDHVVGLETLARAYADGNGVLGGDFCKIAIENHHIEVALFDSNLAGKRTVDGVEMDTTPHVKVDDVKDPQDCGRIYFAIISGEGFVVDHIGLHDYS